MLTTREYASRAASSRASLAAESSAADSLDTADSSSAGAMNRFMVPLASRLAGRGGLAADGDRALFGATDDSDLVGDSGRGNRLDEGVRVGD